MPENPSTSTSACVNGWAGPSGIVTATPKTLRVADGCVKGWADPSGIVTLVYLDQVIDRRIRLLT